MSPENPGDPRNIANGFEIPSEGYCDQPYVVKTDDGAWLCVLTTGQGHEGDHGQHVVSTRSTDGGRTWSDLVDIEPSGPPESSWVMPVKMPGGRVYAIYVHNTDNLREVTSDAGPIGRVDSLGYYMFRYSDDHGRTWSEDRYEIPVRMTQIDRENPYRGSVRFFWGVGKPMIHDGKVYFGFAKVGRFGHGFMATSEGYFLCSENMLTEKDPAKIRWTLLPDGEIGLRAPEGPVADEHNLVALSDGSLYCTYRTIDGHNCHAYSRDGGHTWDGPQYATYTPGGRRIRHPRAANFVRKLGNGKYILWYHNHGGTWYFDRNPAWLCGGVEREGYIHWSQPEVMLYADDPKTRMSYPDFIEEEERFFIAETQKTVARVHEVDPALLEGLWNQAELQTIAERGLVLDLQAEEEGSLETEAEMPRLPDLSQGDGCAADLWVRFDDLDAGQVILDTRGEDGKGIVLLTTDLGTVRIRLTDGRTECSWDCDREILGTGTWHHVAVSVDGGPKLITFVVDGVLCDGGRYRQFGWGRFNRDLGDVNGAARVRIAPSLHGRLAVLRIYDRYLRISEAVGNFLKGVRYVR